jgi:hypothetical protein
MRARVVLTLGDTDPAGSNHKTKLVR